MTREAVEQAIAEALLDREIAAGYLLAQFRDAHTARARESAVDALDAALAAGCLLPENPDVGSGRDAIEAGARALHDMDAAHAQAVATAVIQAARPSLEAEWRRVRLERIAWVRWVRDHGSDHPIFDTVRMGEPVEPVFILRGANHA